eukprot:TRINITY_DN16965_c0_g1_i1.p1 TRINITY_DN16965_c0_g1~~TRINITY_DN16965_c0_g1_i1.p1  ORF type:complete len:103 (+),score=4.52 TRINITY_DN16965_c0_g1_i1:3-311(+)
MKESAKSLIELHNISKHAFELILEYIYTGTCNFSSDTIMELFVMSDRFILLDLKDKCSKYLERVLSDQTVNDILNVAENLHSSALVEKCKNLLKRLEQAKKV